MTEINPVNFNGVKIKGPEKMSKAENLIEEKTKTIISKLHQRAEREVPEYGDFSVVYEEFKNPDKNLSASDFMLKIYKPKNAKDEKFRCIEAVAYALPKPYKSEALIAQGNKEEILNILQNEEFVEVLQNTFTRLSANLEDM